MELCLRMRQEQVCDVTGVGSALDEVKKAHGIQRHLSPLLSSPPAFLLLLLPTLSRPLLFSS